MRKIAIIINSKAKNAAGFQAYKEGFEKAELSYQLYETEPEHLESIVKKCITLHKIILIGGGDGTIRTAAQWCTQTAAILGVLPLGTLNHFAKELCLPQNVTEIIEAIEKQETVIIDLAEVNGFIFINNSSIGFYPKFADKRDAYSKSYSKWLSYIPSFIESLTKHKSFSVTIKSKERDYSLRTSFLMISNNMYSYEFPITVKRTSFQKATLGLYYFKHGKIELIKIIKSLFNKRRQFEIKKSKGPIEIHFDHQKEVTISLDGDTMKVKTPLHYQCRPHALTVLTKPSCE